MLKLIAEEIVSLFDIDSLLACVCVDINSYKEIVPSGLTLIVY